MTRNRRRATAALALLAIAASTFHMAMPHAAAQNGAESGAPAVAPGRGPWQATVQSYYLKPARVALDAECGDEVSADLRAVIEEALARHGIGVDHDARDVLRYSVTPCTVLTRGRDALLRDAYDGTSRHLETPTLEPQFKLKFGGKTESADRLSLSLFLYTPGSAPSWQAEATVGRSGATRMVQFTALAKTMVGALGEARAETILTP